MTTNEIKERIAELERQIFFLDMKDRWDTNDYIIQNKRHAEVRQLKQELTQRGE